MCLQAKSEDDVISGCLTFWNLLSLQNIDAICTGSVQNDGSITAGTFAQRYTVSDPRHMIVRVTVATGRRKLWPIVLFRTFRGAVLGL